MSQEKFPTIEITHPKDKHLRSHDEGSRRRELAISPKFFFAYLCLVSGEWQHVLPTEKTYVPLSPTKEEKQREHAH
jgi:hypothetical protein